MEGMPENTRASSAVPGARAGLPSPRTDLAGMEPYGAPQIDVPHLLNVNENPFGPSDALAKDLGAAVRIAAKDLHRYPDREFTALSRELVPGAPLPKPTPVFPRYEEPSKD